LAKTAAHMVGHGMTTTSGGSLLAEDVVVRFWRS